MSGNNVTEREYNLSRATLTAKEAAEYVGVSYWLLLELVKRKEIPAIHAGRRVLFRKESLDRWMEGQEKNNMKPGQEPEYGKIRPIMAR